MLESSAEVCGFVVSIDDVLLTLAGAVEEAEISAFVGEVLNSIAKCETCSDWILRNAEQLFATCVSLFETLRLREVNSAFEVLRSILEKPNLEFGIEWIRWFLQEDTQQRIRFTLLNAPSQLDQLPISILYVLKTLIAVAEEMRRGYEGFLLTMDPKALPSNEEAVQLFLECVDLLDVPLDPSSPLVEFLVEQQSARSGNSLISVMGRLIRKVE
ncbi:hypothetical protein L596_008265 [Steinernema carpocapsae]|uniref:Uncharacterized protein n=1 Tax=Steinernema carpocapsae TaxID=34508 RepID=A0A4U5PC13_STECR|nr:hypothetical protein L596_008265 [Steinernema carpocapsae]